MKFLLMILACCLFTESAFTYDEGTKDEIFPSTPQQVAALNTKPKFLVGGIVSPLSGGPCLQQRDLVVKGAQELTLSRTYISPYMPVQFAHEKQDREQWEKCYLYEYVARYYRGWQFYPHLKLRLIPGEKKVLVTNSNGSTLCFSLPNSGKANLVGEPYGISNCIGEVPSGANDPRNTRIAFDEKGKRITVYTAHQETRVYCFKGWDSEQTQLYLLEKEILPSGKIIKYHYEGLNPVYVESLDPKERFVYASIRVQGSPQKGNCHFLSSSGQTTDYEYQIRKEDVEAEKITKKRWYWTDDKRKIKDQFVCPPLLSKVSSPSFRNEQLTYCGRFLLSFFGGKDHQFQVYNRAYGNAQKDYKVHQLFLPVGKEDALTPVYELSYDPPIAGKKRGTTTVKASDGTTTIYHFYQNLLTSKIQYFGEDGSLKKEKYFSWNDQNWLKTIEIRDEQNNLFYQKTFEYDLFGNPIFETFTGDLSGLGEMEPIWTKRIFSKDGKNLLLREEKESGKAISFSYLKGTNLITSKLIWDRDLVIRREFWNYDDCHNLIESVIDDGKSTDQEDLTGMTERRKKTYLLRQTAPFLHMPEWKIETYLNCGSYKLLRKTHLIYDACGNVIREKVYDADGNYAYTIEKTYNERGDLLSETNRLGQKAIFSYDAKGRRLTESNFSGRLHKTHVYDTRGRLCKTLEEGDNGNCHTRTSTYDFHDRLVKREDPFGNCTYYKHDPLVDRVSRTDFPKVADPNGRAKAVAAFSTYDPFGRETSSTDPNGNQTSYAYNVYGSVSEIHHPDGAIETFRYSKQGDLIAQTDPDGLTIQYENDVLGRVCKKTYLSKEGNTIAEETFCYNGFHLISETDKEGNLTQYFYDGAGRKIREEFCGRVTEFTYDSLNRLETVYKFNGDDALVTHYERDLEDRIILEKKTDLFGNILFQIKFSYDADGNRNTTVRYINGEEAIETFEYDPFRRILCNRDALGYATHTTYDERFTNDRGQRVLQIRKEDPAGITLLTTFDALSRKVRVEKRGSCGQTILCQEMIYDPQGNLTLHKDHIYEDGKFKKTQEVGYSYTPNHQIKSLIRGDETSAVRKTTYSYSPSGKLDKKTLPDDITLFYSYHPLGYLARVESSDGTLSHAFMYNKSGDLLIAVDEKQNLRLERKVDPFGNVICEEFPHGIQVAKTYDDLNRMLSLRIAERGEVHYVYDPLFLREIKRISALGEPLYQHAFDEYDLNGSLAKERLIGNLGTITHTTGARGQRTQIASPYFSQKCQYNCVQNLVSSETDRAKSSYAYDDTSQMIREESSGDSITYCHDSLYNRMQKNDSLYEVNHLNELLFDGETAYEYDLRGNQRRTSTGWEMTYDPLNQLIEAKSQKQKIEFIYDPLGRRLAKVTSTKNDNAWGELSREHYIYDGEEEIGSFQSPSMLESFRVLSTHALPKTVSVELGGKIFAPLVDVQGNIRRLVELKSKALAVSYDYTAFGEKLQTSATIQNPWQFASKRLDANLGLIFFGKRYYNPRIGRWLATDPAGFEDSFNPYQYVLNNPFRYYDLNGESLGGWFLGVGEIALGGFLILSGGVLEIATFGGYTVGFGIQFGAGAALISTGLATTTYHAQDISFPKRTEFPSTASQEYQTNGLTIIPVPDGCGNLARIEKNDGTPGSNTAQNKQFNDAVKEVEKQTGSKLKENEIDQLHDEISGKNYSYWDIVEEGVGMFDKGYKNQ